LRNQCKGILFRVLEGCKRGNVPSSPSSPLPPSPFHSKRRKLRRFHYWRKRVKVRPRQKGRMALAPLLLNKEWMDIGLVGMTSFNMEFDLGPGDTHYVLTHSTCMFSTLEWSWRRRKGELLSSQGKKLSLPSSKIISRGKGWGRELDSEWTGSRPRECSQVCLGSSGSS